MTKKTTIFNQDDPIGTIWANTRVRPFELYERREGMFKFIGYDRVYSNWGTAPSFKPRKRVNLPHKKDIQLYGKDLGLSKALLETPIPQGMGDMWKDVPNTPPKAVYASKIWGKPTSKESLPVLNDPEFPEDSEKT